MPEPPKVDIVEFVDQTNWTYVILALAVGLAVGAAALYLFTEHVPEGEGAPDA